LADHDIAINSRRDIRIKSILKEEGIVTVAVSRAFYPEKEDYREYEILKCIRDKRTLDDDVYYDEGRYFLNKEEFAGLYDRDDIRNTDRLASLCDVRCEQHTSLPLYPTPGGISSRDYLVALCKEGLRRRLKGNNDTTYTKRLEYELKTIIDMHFEDYFLIVYDFILHAKKNGIMVGPGRGSAAGSLVSYCLGITDIDPIRYGLLFERFLNPERISMPDIDTDFPDDRRSEMFSYVRDKYGIDHVGHIMAFGTMKARQVLRDVGRVLKYSNTELDMITKSIPSSYYNTTLDDAYNSSPLFRQRIESQQKYRDLFRIARKLEGFPRHETIHPAGVVMSRLPLEEVVPLARVETDLFSTQYTMEYLESLGLIKMDFLGLRNLGIIAEITDDIRANVDASFNIKEIPLDDRRTFDLINNVDLLGVFQLESSGMQNLARKMKPRTFEELGMMIALFRPGPMENIPQFLENRAHPNNITYLVPALMPILEETYGIIVYQEQIMTIARVLAGFTYGKADILRKAMSKKKASELEGLKSDFISGCIANGYEKSVAVSIYELVLKFANYGFNKSHSIAYAMVAYQLAYLKANYPVWFYKALLNGVIGSETRTYEYIKECGNVGQSVKGISINRSTDVYTVEDGSIRMPFGVCKDVGTVSTVKIIEERKNGEFRDYLDCICRLSLKGVEKNVIENLIYAGALDELGLSRHA
ncbi:MAG: DNA polymerase III subunit alpha, partial [Erysipelotrichaceae bacterium]|nr:DNA polymerase III subunit alpha [Erysipelotrichaceae bacterium]